ncbi:MULTISPECIES: type IX secretion system protein PorG [Chitinophagaceae]
MFKKLVILVCFILAKECISAQTYESYQHKGEIGAGIGASNYFGDLNPNENFKRLKFAGNLYYQYYINNYIGVKLSGLYTRLGNSDVYNKNQAYRTRNLSFNTDIWELSLSGTFNFFKFLPGIEGHRFTPYISAGVGVFSYNPYSYLNVDGAEQKVFLRPLGTEGQNSTTLHDGKKYGSTALAFPLTLGVKYAITENFNIFAEVGYRFTTTDYLDDVSTTYAGVEAFQANNYNGSPKDLWYAQRLQDRSGAVALQPIGNAGISRGNSKAKDSYIIGLIGLSFNINGYKCPPSAQ